MPAFSPVTLTTERLTLRSIEKSDADAHFAIFSDPAVMRYWSSVAWTDMAQAHAEVQRTLDAYADGSTLCLGVVLRTTGEMVGVVTLYSIHHESRRCGLGYALAQAHWGKGYLGEAVATMLAHGFGELNLNRVEADVDPRNSASEKLLQRMGFQKEGYMPQRWIVNGEVGDTVFYGLLRSGWENR
ncbi:MULTISPECIES: GNAT family N-acetyltransferase [unclassified Janthinobacterium]|uniref:GNAT family N-acetyltransferase n=1 Tax=unclassified Janthinobacterium TaxID=2610881 RepID=UPI0004775569|nr:MULTISPECIES: GNAT family protein [unclassified Janthinobacterium]MEC5161110.1 ribosomal-protein-alanine N-acetyltransferase [Janthinobacterium sp. CG_S6]